MGLRYGFDFRPGEWFYPASPPNPIGPVFETQVRIYELRGLAWQKGPKHVR